MFYRDAIRTLQAWGPLKDQFAELDLIRKMLDAEIHYAPVNPTEEEVETERSLHYAD